MIPDARELSEALAAVGVDGWLLFAFHGLNPVATRVLGLEGLNTRRLFVLLPREGEPVAVAHRIELSSVEGFPGRVLPYSRWQELHAALGSIVAGRRLAMEISPEDAVPYLDRVPYGVIELLRRLGGTIVPSGPLVSRFAARWSVREAADHRFAAEVLAEVAQAELARAVREGDGGLTESALQGRVVAAAHSSASTTWCSSSASTDAPEVRVHGISRGLWSPESCRSAAFTAASAPRGRGGGAATTVMGRAGSMLHTCAAPAAMARCSRCVDSPACRRVSEWCAARPE